MFGDSEGPPINYKGPDHSYHGPESLPLLGYVHEEEESGHSMWVDPNPGGHDDFDLEKHGHNEGDDAAKSGCCTIL